MESRIPACHRVPTPVTESRIPARSPESWRCGVQGGIDRGWFRFPRSTKDGKPHLPSILAIAADIASAMTYLHDAGIVHGDLCGGNILLTSGEGERAGALGFVAKVRQDLGKGLGRRSLIRS